MEFSSRTDHGASQNRGIVTDMIEKDLQRPSELLGLDKFNTQKTRIRNIETKAAKNSAKNLRDLFCRHCISPFEAVRLYSYMLVVYLVTRVDVAIILLLTTT
jgi:hypothetical protein